MLCVCALLVCVCLDGGGEPVKVRSSVNPSIFQSLTVLSEDVVTIWRTSGLSRTFKMCLPALKPTNIGNMLSLARTITVSPTQRPCMHFEKTIALMEGAACEILVPSQILRLCLPAVFLDSPTKNPSIFFPPSHLSFQSCAIHQGAAGSLWTKHLPWGRC
jgi:hypothetical protein